MFLEKCIAKNVTPVWGQDCEGVLKRYQTIEDMLFQSLHHLLLCSTSEVNGGDRENTFVLGSNVPSICEANFGGRFPSSTVSVNKLWSRAQTHPTPTCWIDRFAFRRGLPYTDWSHLHTPTLTDPELNLVVLWERVIVSVSHSEIWCWREHAEENGSCVAKGKGKKQQSSTELQQITK